MPRMVLLEPRATDGAGEAAFASFPGGGFVVASRNPHAHWPPKGELLSLKAVLDGTEEFQIGRRRLEIRPGRCLLVPQGLPYASRVTSPTVAMCPIFFSRRDGREVSAVLEATPEEDLLEGGGQGKDPEAVLLPRDPRVAAAVKRIWQRLRKAAAETPAETDSVRMEAPDAVALQSAVLESLAMALDGCERLRRRLDRLGATRHATREEIHLRLARAEDRLHAEFGRPLSLADLARTACMSPYHFLRRFSEFHGEPPHRRLVRIRMNHARRLAGKGGLQTAEIARACGYRSVPSFIRAYRRFWGSTPGGLPA